tara:strand:- start:1334 stop:2239 length:906 start_codon:yes stop_codon:yes gene_type:complete
MVAITNNKGFPLALVKAVENDSYSKGRADRSVTGLLSPPRQAALKDIHEDVLTEDVSERTFALYGQLVHLLLERSGEQDRNALTEERMFTEVEGWTISGQTDTITLTEDEAWVVSDYKFVTAYKFKRDYSGQLVMPAEYEQQLNMYAHLLRENGFKVDGLKIVAIYRDWSKMEAKRDKNYPQLGAETHDVKLWSEEDAKAFMEERVRLHQAAENDLPECNDEERWARPDKYALKTNATSVRARKLFDTEVDAVTWAYENKMKKGWVVDHRPGVNIRCENYCLVSEYCEQFSALQKIQIGHS